MGSWELLPKYQVAPCNHKLTKISKLYRRKTDLSFRKVSVFSQTKQVKLDILAKLTHCFTGMKSKVFLEREFRLLARL